jgi:PAS domain S-box-containing protein
MSEKKKVSHLARAHAAAAPDALTTDKADQLAQELQLQNEALRRTRAALAAAEERHAQVAEQSQVLAWEVDLDGLYTYVSRVAETMLGYRADELVGRKHFYDLHPAAGREAFKQAAFAVFASKAAFRELLNPAETKDGRIIWLTTSGVPVLDGDGRLQGYRGSDVDSTARRQAETALHLKSAFLEAQVNAALDGILVIDARQKRVLINQRMIELFKVPPHLLQDEDDFHLLRHVTRLTKHPEQFLEKVQYLYEHRQETSRDDIELADGMLIDRYSAPVLGPQGQYYGRTWTFRDITARKRTEEALRQSTERLSLATRAGGVGIWDYDVVHNHLVWDDEMFRLYGITRAQFGGAYEAWQAGLHPDDRLRGDEAIQLALRGEKDFDIEFRVLWPDGTVRQIQGLASVQRDAAGQPLRMIGTNWDITAQKQAAESIRRQASLIESLLDSIPDIIFFKDVQGVYLGCNPPFAEFVGRPREQIIGQTDLTLFGPAVADAFREHDQSMLARCEPRHNEEEISYPDGRKRLIDTLKTPYRGPDGQLVGILGISRDITARKQAEAALRESEANFRAFFETMQDLIMVGTPDGRLLFTNAAVTRTLGYTPEELQRMHVLDVHPADKRREAEAIFAAMFKGERESCPLPLARKDGSLVPVETRVWFGKWNGADCIFGLSKDLSAEQEAKQRFERLFRSNPTLMALSDLPDRRFTDVNDAFLLKLGYAREDVLGKTSTELNLFIRADQQAALAGDLLKAGRIADFELQVRRKDGTLLDGLFSGEVISSQGRLYLLTVMIDITARKQAEAALRAAALYTRKLIEASLDPLVTISAEGKITDLNIATEKITGVAREQLLGSDFADYFTEPEKAREGYQRAFELGQVIDCPLVLRHISGALTEVLYNVSVYRDDAGHILGVFAAARDVTERKRVAEELASPAHIQRELMHLATDFVNVPVEQQDAAIDQSLTTMGGLIHADRAYLFAYDFDRDSMSNTHEWCGPGITPELGNLQGIPNAMLPDWVAAHRRGALVHIPSVAALPAGGYLREVLEPQGIRSLITLPLMQGAACLGFVGFDAVRAERVWREEEVALLHVLAELYAHFEARRATERATRELQGRLTLALDEAQAAGQAKSLFLANMSHEIRTPLNAILGYAQIMEHECRACPTKQRLYAIARSGEHLLELITNLMELVRSDVRTIMLTPGDFDFLRMLEDVRIMFARRAQEQALTLTVTAAPDVPQFLCADQGKLRQILVNLVGNALKFTEKGGVRLTVTAGPAEGPDHLTLAIEIADTGSGIPPDELEGIFELFKQTERSRKSGQGTGLGLPLSRRYARALGGDVTVTSTPGVGSRFRLTFRAKAASGSAPLPRGNVLWLAPQQRPYRLLAVDDDPANLKMLDVMLTAVGFTVETATSAAQALQRLGQPGRPDLVLLDKNMPVMNGLEALARIRTLPDGQRPAVLVVTASGFADEYEQALAAGADGFVAKPVRREVLLEEIARVCGARYEYEPPPAAAPAVTDLTPAALACLPAAQHQLLEQALRRGDIRQLRETVAAIARDQAGLAAGIRVLVDAYDYKRLSELLKTAKGAVG